MNAQILNSDVSAKFAQIVAKIMNHKKGIHKHPKIQVTDPFSFMKIVGAGDQIMFTGLGNSGSLFANFVGYDKIFFFDNSGVGGDSPMTILNRMGLSEKAVVHMVGAGELSTAIEASMTKTQRAKVEGQKVYTKMKASFNKGQSSSSIHAKRDRVENRLVNQIDYSTRKLTWKQEKEKALNEFLACFEIMVRFFSAKGYLVEREIVFPRFVRSEKAREKFAAALGGMMTFESFSEQQLHINNMIMDILYGMKTSLIWSDILEVDFIRNAKSVMLDAVDQVTAQGLTDKVFKDVNTITGTMVVDQIMRESGVEGVILHMVDVLDLMLKHEESFRDCYDGVIMTDPNDLDELDLQTLYECDYLTIDDFDMNDPNLDQDTWEMLYTIAKRRFVADRLEQEGERNNLMHIAYKAIKTLNIK